MNRVFNRYTGTAFRYRSFSTPGVEKAECKRRLEEIIVDGKFWFSRPDKLNDVHEFNPEVVRDPLAARTRLTKKLKERGVAANSSYVSDLMQRQWQVIQENPVQKLLSDWGICSMSKSGTLHTQWAYYGGNHFGYAIEIDVPKELACYEVIYTDTRPVIHFPNCLNGIKLEEAMCIALSKSTEWEKEKEVRWISNAPGLYAVKKYIKSIVFGARTDPDDKDYVRDLVNANNLPIQLRQCKVTQGRFDLEIVPYSD